MGVTLVVDTKCTKHCKYFDNSVKPYVADSYKVIGFCYRYAAWVIKEEHEGIPTITCIEYKHYG